MGKKMKKLSFEDFGHKLDLEILLPIIRFRGTAEAAVYFAKLWPKVRQQTIALCGSNFHVTLGSSPQLYNLTQSVSDTLSIGDKIPQFYVEEGYFPNNDGAPKRESRSRDEDRPTGRRTPSRREEAF